MFDRILDKIERLIKAKHRTAAVLAAEQSQLHSEAFFHGIFDNVGTAAVVATPDGTIRLVNRAMEAMSGYTRAEMEGGHRWQDFVHPEDLPRLQEYARTRAADPDTPRRSFEARFLDVRQEVHDLLVTISEAPDPGLFVYSLTDITHMKGIQEQLRLRDEQLQAIVQNLPGVIFQFYARDNGERGFYYLGQKILELFSMPTDRDNFLENWLALVPDKLRPQILASAREAMDNEQAWNFESPVTSPDGSIQWFRIIATPFRHGDELIYNGFILEITDQKILEQQKEEALEALQQSEAKYRMLVDYAGDAIWTTDMDLKVSYISQSAERMFGWTIDEWPDVPAEAYIAATSLAHLREKMQIQLEISKNTGMDPERVSLLEVEHLRKDGSSFWSEVTVRFLLDSQRQPLGLLGITRDTSERRRLQEALVRTEKMITVAGLAAGMAHEINNPLGIILQSAENAQRRLTARLPANRAAADQAGLDLEALQKYMSVRKIDHYLDSIHEAGARAARIVSSMLHFSRQSESIFSWLNVNDILERTLELAGSDYDLGKKYDFRNVQIIKDYGDLPTIPCVETELEQVFFNLLKNAAQALSAKQFGDERPAVRITTWSSPESVFIEIEDNGPGLDEETCSRIFEPFYTTKEPGSGTGLGLSVSYFVVVNSHQGHLQVNSQPGAWTRFTVELPRQRVT